MLVLEGILCPKAFCPHRLTIPHVPWPVPEVGVGSSEQDGGPTWSEEQPTSTVLSHMALGSTLKMNTHSETLLSS